MVRIALNTCKEYYNEKEDSRKQEIRDMRKEILGCLPDIHVHQHNTLTESERTKTVAKDSMTKSMAGSVMSISGWLILAGIAAWELKP